MIYLFTPSTSPELRIVKRKEGSLFPQKCLGEFWPKVAQAVSKSGSKSTFRAPLMHVWAILSLSDYSALSRCKHVYCSQRKSGYPPGHHFPAIITSICTSVPRNPWKLISPAGFDDFRDTFRLLHDTKLQSNGSAASAEATRPLNMMRFICSLRHFAMCGLS